MEYPEKTPGNELQKMPHTKVKKMPHTISNYHNCYCAVCVQVASAVLKELPEADKRESLATDLLTVVSSLLLHSSDCLSVETTARLVVQVSHVQKIKIKREREF